MISIRKLEKKDNKQFAKLIAQDLPNYQEFIEKGWSLKEINNQFNKIWDEISAIRTEPKNPENPAKEDVE